MLALSRSGFYTMINTNFKLNIVLHKMLSKICQKITFYLKVLKYVKVNNCFILWNNILEK